MSRSNTRRACHEDLPIAQDDEETARLPALSLGTIDELIALGRSINDHLESLAGKRKTPAWAPKNRGDS